MLRLVARRATGPQLAAPAQPKAGEQASFINAPNAMFTLTLIREECLRARIHVCFDIAPRLLLVTPDVADITHMTLLAKPQKSPGLKIR